MKPISTVTLPSAICHDKVSRKNKYENAPPASAINIAKPKSPRIRFIRPDGPIS